jgi:hypothetical protein
VKALTTGRCSSASSQSDGQIPWGSIDFISDWPLNSPALSVIENIWDIHTPKIAKRRPKTIADLRLLIQEEWENLYQIAID